ncbi:MAG: NADP-dependent malic enzyme [Phycisphaera sp.]|nr:MAG: NADP-dependent malic enzyme [Phycisphaera sp.]
MKIPQVLLVEVQHAPGQLAKMLTEIASLELTVEGLEAQSRTQDKTIWELTLEIDPGQEAAVEAAVERSGIARVVGTSDRAFSRHIGGKIDVRSTVQFDDLKTLRDVYTPGVARVCLAIQRDPSLAEKYTAIKRTVGIVTNGTAILGLGDIGPVAGMPVMEGKSALFQEFGAVSAVPILTTHKRAEDIVSLVKGIAPTFGAIQLEDIAAPECFEIENRLRECLDIPVLHDDQHGTAVVVLAALLRGETIAGFDLRASKIGQVGLGAAGMGIARLLLRYGVPEVLGADLSDDAMTRFEAFGGVRSTLRGVMQNAEIIIATTGAPGLIKPEMIREGQTIFALSNPEPEIEPTLALEQGARFAADGKNINNVLAFPGLFRGALDAGASEFNDDMLFAAARAIAEAAATGGETGLIPSPLCRRTHAMVAAYVKESALAT